LFSATAWNVAPVARLVDPAASRLADLGGDPPATDRLAAQADAVRFVQLLDGRCRTKAPVALTDDRQRHVA
jgi:hypothetical protein